MKKGICHLCQEEADLTFEHIPPHRAFNYQRAKVIEGDELIKTICDEKRLPWDYSNLKYSQKQRGVGLYSLCSRCNNITGKYYGNEYIKFANTIDYLFPQFQGKIAGLQVNRMNPLLFSKQVLSMFYSTCSNITQNDPNIINLLLNKESRGIDHIKYRVSMYLIRERKIGYTGMQVLGIIGGQSRVVASIDAYPFGFLMEFDPKTIRIY